MQSHEHASTQATAASPARDTGPALPPTEKQLLYARRIASRSGSLLPWDVQQDRQSLSRWIDTHAHLGAPTTGAEARPSSRQVGFAERLAKRKRTHVPDECFRSRDLMSRWIDRHC